MMAAALLHDGISVLHGCPKIADVLCMIQILGSLGAVAWWEGHSLYLDCRNITGVEVQESYAREMRSSVILLGALLGRKREARIGYPGGCVIGKRPINLHLDILKRMGAVIREEGDQIHASCTGMAGCHIYLPMSSVGATEQGILAAVLAEGTTYLHHCAMEPEIFWMQEFLRGMGADIAGAGTDTICVCGVKRLRDSHFWIPPDRIVAGTYLCAGAITRGRLVLENCPIGELKAFLQVYGKMGGQFQYNSGTLLADSRSLFSPIPYLETAVYPGFPTDLQSPLLAVLAMAKGESLLRENIFEDRYKAVEQLNRMGADITVQGRDAYVMGVSGLHGCEVLAEELRGGAALVLAGLAAEGETIVKGCQFIQRGYESICEDFTALGGRISI